jgi:hypothetical protein
MSSADHPRRFVTQNGVVHLASSAEGAEQW